MFSSHQICYINSAERSTGTDGNFRYSLKLDQTDYDHVCVLGVSIPKSYYIVQVGQNTMTLSENGVNVTITVQPGNYNYLSFKALIPTLLNTASPNHWTYAMSYPNRLTSADTGLFTYTVTGNGGLQPSFIFTDYLYEQFGFSMDSTNTFVSNTLTSAGVVNFTPEGTLFLHSDMVAEKGVTNILQDIYDNNNSPMSYIVWSNPGNIEAYSKKLAVPGSQGFSFNLTNELNQDIILNGRNMLITLVIYKKDDTNKVIRALSELYYRKNK